MRSFSPAKTSVPDPGVNHFGYDRPCNLAETVETYGTGALINRTVPNGNDRTNRGFYSNHPNLSESYINGVTPVNLYYDASRNITTRTDNTLPNVYDIVPKRIQKIQQTAPHRARQNANTKDEGSKKHDRCNPARMPEGAIE